MNLGIWLLLIAVFWLGAMSGIGFLAILVAHGEREKEAEEIPVRMEAET